MPTSRKSTVRHTRAVQRDRRVHLPAAPPDPVLEQHLTELIHPLTLAQVAHFHDLGLRERTLTLPVMMAFTLSLIWRQVGSVRETVRLLRQEGLLWTSPQPVSPQAVLLRLGTLPAALFADVLQDLVPLAVARWQARQRPLAPALAWAQTQFARVWAVDGSTLDSLLRQTGLLRAAPGTPLAGRMGALLDVLVRVPQQIWYEEDSAAHDQRFWPTILAQVPAETLLLLDAGFVNYGAFDQLTTQQISFIIRAKANAAYTEVAVLRQNGQVRDRIIRLGRGATACQERLRLVEICVAGQWYRYLTNVLDPARLPTEYVAVVYGHRWRIEEAFAAVKRLLGLAYFWTGGQNGIQVQLWATWILYVVLVDLRDAVAEAVGRPADALSLEMVYRGLYHFTQAYQRGTAQEPVSYLATHARALDLIKRKRPRALARLPDLTLVEKP